MSKQAPAVYNNAEGCVDEVINIVGKNIVFGMPLALGKPNNFVNELYRRVKDDHSMSLTIVTALALEKPSWTSDLERRLLEPLVERIFGDFPDFEYMKDLRSGSLPSNVQIVEFFNKAGGYLNVPVAQQNHLCSNYTHAMRDAIDFGVNVMGQMISKNEVDGVLKYSMSCNPAIALEGIDAFNRMKKAGKKVVVVGEINENLPFMYGDAMVDVDTYDMVLEGPDFNYKLFGPPKESVDTIDHMIGLNVSPLIKDGGSIQIGIGSLGDALVNGMKMRQESNGDYQKVLSNTGVLSRYGDLIEKLGGTEAFDKGLYGSSEMLIDGFMHLYECGILKRKVYENAELQKLINEGKISEKITPEAFENIIQSGAVEKRISERDFNFLQSFGIFKENLKYEDGSIVNGAGRWSGNLKDEAAKKAIMDNCLGDKLTGGVVIHGGFFIGPCSFYDTLNNMSEEERMQFEMTGVAKVNQLYGDEELRRLQRKDGRFVNAGLMATLSGAIVSDCLEDGRVISGIGGQYNFVAMAHALEDGRLIMMIRSTRKKGKKVFSNIVFNYGHCSVPRHLRDFVVTEYGIANLRGKTDKQIIAELINIADSRFQQELLDKAKKAKKIPEDYTIPERYTNNYPEQLEKVLKPYKEEGYFKLFPFGTDITDEEVAIGGSLRAFKADVECEKLKTIKGFIKQMVSSVPEGATPYLQRMDLEEPSGLKEKLMRGVVVYALKSAGKI